MRALLALLALVLTVTACGSAVDSGPAAGTGTEAGVERDEERASSPEPPAEDGDEPPAGEEPATDEPPADTEPSAGDEPLTDPPADDEYERAQVTLRGPDEESVEVPVYVADEPALRQQGLMHRDELAPGAGMVFVFPDDNEGGFWMKNTRIPLSIAYFSADGDVLAVLDMEPCEADPCPSYDPGVAYRGTLEVNEGFFDEVGLDEDWRVELPPGVEAVE